VRHGYRAVSDLLDPVVPEGAMSIEELAELNPDALTPDGLEAAYIGFTMNHHHAHVAVYSYEKCVGILVDRDGMTPDDAEEYLSFNTLGAWVGEDGPLFVSKPTLS
jgi:hypothetical protein